MQQRRQLLSSPLKRSNTTPNFRSKANQVLDEGEDDGEEEDEETLELRLAEIQARLKLKQLKSRGRSGTATSFTEDEGSSFDSNSRPQRRPSIPKSPPPSQRKALASEVQVPVSPQKRMTAAPEPWSPKRYQLGIDKGWKANDVSLKRPPRPGMAARPTSQLGTRSGAMSRQSDTFSPRPQTSPGGGGMPKIKSFSERMAEGRAAERAEKSRMEKAERVEASRSTAFQLDKAEIESFKAAAANEPEYSLPSVREPETHSFNREEILRSFNRPQSGGLKRSQTTGNMREDSARRKVNKNDDQDAQASKGPDSSKFESYSSLHLASRILPHSFLSRTLSDKTVLRIPDLLKKVKGPAFELPEEIDGDFVVFGIVASKSDTKQTKQPENSTAKAVDPYDDGLNNSNSYMAITLTDLNWTIDLFLFDTAFPRYYKINEGTVVAILNPTILPPPKHKIDTNRFSLALSSSDDKVLEIGKARDIGYCKSVRKDGKVCRSWLDARKTEFCDFHVDLQVRWTQGQRSGVNSGVGQFGAGGRSGSRMGWYDEGERRRKGSPYHDPREVKGRGLKPEGGQYDYASGSTYFVAPAPKNRGAGRTSYNPVAGGQGSAAMLDNSDDPFIAAGMMGRGMENKEERARRRLIAQQRELDITRKLVSGRAGGVGGEYLRTRTETPTQEKPSSTPKAPSSSNDFNLASFGRAKTVHLSPRKRAHDGEKPHGSGLKKTRFITSKGIREAGRESLGGPEATVNKQQTPDDDDDDDLEFV